MPVTEPAADCWLHPAVVRGPSAIAGTGLFTSTPLPAGTPVSRLGGRLVTTDELRLMRDSGGRVASIAVDDDLQLVLPTGSDTIYANHSCAPNTAWDGGYTLVTLRDVAAGEELTYDYATSTADPSYLLRCHCQAYGCRQMIEGTDWRIPQLQRRYAGHWVPYLQRLISAAAG